MAGQLILISGPVRSGKSTYAEKLAGQLAGTASVAYIATAQAFDEEMAVRIQKHQAQRPGHWQTFEAPLDPCQAIEAGYAAGQRIFLLDCLTMLVSNWLYKLNPTPENDQLIGFDEQAKIEQVVQKLGKTILNLEDATLIVVTNEVGWGLVPDYPLGRLYRDLAGRTNRILAEMAAQVWLIVMGLPLQLK